MRPTGGLIRLFLASSLLATGSAAAGGGPRISQVRPVEDLPVLVVDLEYPKSWPDTEFTFEADGHAVPSHPAGGGFDERSKQAFYEVFPGASCKRLVARWGKGKRTSPASLSWTAPTLVVLLDRLGDREALLDPGDLEFQVFPPATVLFLQGEEELRAKPAGESGPGRRVRITPRWSPGLNTIHVLTTGPAGRAERSLTFAPLSQGLPVGQAARLVYGEVGSKSGPFYGISVEGEALGIERRGFGRLVSTDRDGWPGWTEVLVADVVGKAPGESTLQITVKPHFLQPAEPGREQRVRVVASPPEPAPPARDGSGLRHDPVQDDPRYADVFARIDAEVDALLADHPSRGAMGFCHVIWSTKKRLLKEKYGIDWQPPDEMNPQVIFD